jgi:hypothetical protein
MNIFADYLNEFIVSDLEFIQFTLGVAQFI